MWRGREEITNTLLIYEFLKNKSNKKIRHMIKQRARLIAVTFLESTVCLGTPSEVFLKCHSQGHTFAWFEVGASSRLWLTLFQD